jgi:hypothetical protein
MACERFSGGDSFTGAEAIEDVDETTEFVAAAGGTIVAADTAECVAAAVEEEAAVVVTSVLADVIVTSSAMDPATACALTGILLLLLEIRDLDDA